MSKKKSSSPRRKEARAASWKRGQDRKEARRKSQAEREARNQEWRSQGIPTPWEAAKRIRAIRRTKQRSDAA